MHSPLSICYSSPSLPSPPLPSDKSARVSFEFPVYEVWEDQGPVRLRLKANKPLSMKAKESVYIKPLEIVPVSARGEGEVSLWPLWLRVQHA